MNIRFEDLADYLRHGREIEFSYNGKNYSITNNRRGWQFCCDTDGVPRLLCPFSEFDVLVEKIKATAIDGATVEEIFNQSLGGVKILDIL